VAIDNSRNMFAAVFKHKRQEFINQVHVAHSLLIGLLDRELITEENVQVIDAQITKPAKAFKLIECLTERPDSDYDKFCEALVNTNQRHVVDLLAPAVADQIRQKGRLYEQQATVGQENPEASKLEKVASPEVFISYQWDKQPQIKAMYSKLTSLGYKCWMDNVQMGGGDVLYDELYRGISGCRVVLSCVTSKYAESKNCRREINLADLLDKPIIPLKLDSEMKWPPEGLVGVIISPLLYIKFCGSNDWNGPQFEELKKQIKQHLDNASSASTSMALNGEESDKSMPTFEAVFKGKEDYLQQQLKVSEDFLIKLQERGVLDNKHVQAVKFLLGTNLEVHTLIGLLKSRDNTLLISFCDALIEDDQIVVVDDILSEYHQLKKDSLTRTSKESAAP
jgi:hypothetical protein